MDWTTRGKTVFITGAARGLGAETARRVAARGANVALVGLEPEELERVAAQCGANAAWFECDVTDTDALERGGGGHGRSLRRHRRGDGERGHRARRDDALDRPGGVRAHDRDQPAGRLAHRARLPAARDRAAAATCYITASMAAAAARARAWPPTAASKAGVEAFGDSLRGEVKHLGVDVGVGYFGFIDTDMVRGADAHPAIGKLREQMGGPTGQDLSALQGGPGDRRRHRGQEAVDRRPGVGAGADRRAHAGPAADRASRLRPTRPRPTRRSCRTSRSAAWPRPRARWARAARPPGGCAGDPRGGEAKLSLAGGRRRGARPLGRRPPSRCPRARVVLERVVLAVLAAVAVVVVVVLGQPLLVRVALGVRVGGAAGDGLALELVRVVGLLAADLDAAVLVVAHRVGAELRLRSLVVGVVALGAAEGLVLRLPVGPVLELVGGILLELVDLLLGLPPSSARALSSRPSLPRS